MVLTDGQLKAIYLVGVALNAIALAYSIDAGEYAFAAAFGIVIVYLALRIRMVAGE